MLSLYIQIGLLSGKSEDSPGVMNISKWKANQVKIYISFSKFFFYELMFIQGYKSQGL